MLAFLHRGPKFKRGPKGQISRSAISALVKSASSANLRSEYGKVDCLSLTVVDGHRAKFGLSENS